MLSIVRQLAHFCFQGTETWTITITSISSSPYSTTLVITSDSSILTSDISSTTLESTQSGNVITFSQTTTEPSSITSTVRSSSIIVSTETTSAYSTLGSTIVSIVDGTQKTLSSFFGTQTTSTIGDPSTVTGSPAQPSTLSPSYITLPVESRTLTSTRTTISSQPVSTTLQLSLDLTGTTSYVTPLTQVLTSSGGIFLQEFSRRLELTHAGNTITTSTVSTVISSVTSSKF